MMNQETSQTIKNNPKSINFPEGKPILAEANTSKQLADILAKSPDLQYLKLLYDSIAPAKNVKAAVEMVVYSLNYLSNKINGITSMQNIIAELFIYYKYEEFIGNELLNKYKITKISENTYEYKIGLQCYSCNFKPKKLII